MHISRADLNLFVVFEAIYSQGGVTRAAETLNLSQPTISHALARLRQSVNDPLFVRQGQRLVPTPLAQRIIGPTRQALGLFEDTLNALEDFDPTTAEIEFSVGMRPLMESTYFLPLVLALNKVAPKVSVVSSSFDRGRLEPALTSGQLNAVIDVFIPMPDEIRRKHLSWAPQVVVARKGNPLCDGHIDLETYLAADHVVVTSRSKGLGPEDIALSRVGKSRKIRARCRQINTAMRIVNASNMLLTMSDTFARRANLRFGNQLLALPFDAPGIDTYLYWHANTDSDPANQWLRAMIQSSVAETESG